MEFVHKIVNAAMGTMNRNTVINVCLVGSFIALAVRSSNQQKVVETLEAEKESLTKSNKAMKKAMWDWKQRLYEEASTDSAAVPLARLKAIYGEAPVAQHSTVGDSVKQGANSSDTPKFVV